MKSNSNYYWIRIFDYIYERDHLENEKGTMLDEFYLKGIADREEVKLQVRERYCSNSKENLRFAKPKKGNNGIYAIVMESTKFYYDRFYCQLDSICFFCNKPIKGKASEFPREFIGEGLFYSPNDDVFSDFNKSAFFCSNECKKDFNIVKRNNEGEFQVKEEGNDGNTFGYVYLIYNREQNTYYIGQTRFLPFFRWQEHIKSGKKGDISDLTFSVLANVNRNRSLTDDQNQHYLNSIESWWIQKYKLEQYNVSNITKPKITVEDLKDRFREMVEGQPLLF
ncbi:GIY-YIG nuclease family protein [Paenibacillus glucanolyticus]|jgi:hypothetical protein|uniref:GIY-YIG domain-containing protein n=1 Tax=Paenibacillus glucanolyticus TaxID=59843 RepID=A0A163GT21_9BACL|nr:GIY-YIG nuclease family protein [Paenibacillus glucanolyticus]KZS45132.1 hypothetical protein AWU65_03885 [Paenibacillus glucanolyticus]OMF65143.1 hypothetical protein BK142_31160 [Paenibacillus glucanolyticus]